MASMVDELRRQDMLRNSGIEMYSSPSLLSSAAKAPQAPKPASAQQGTSLIQRAFPNTVGAVNDRRAQIDTAKQTGGYGAALGQSARTIANPLIGFADDSAQMVKKALDPAAQALKTFATGDATPIGQTPAQTALMTPSSSNEGRNYPSIVPNPNASPVAQMDPTSPSRQDPANPLGGQSSGIINTVRQPNGIMSFSGKNISGDPQYSGDFKPSGAGVSVYKAPISQMASGLPNGWTARDNAIMAANIRDGIDPYRGTVMSPGPAVSIMKDTSGGNGMSWEEAGVLRSLKMATTSTKSKLESSDGYNARIRGAAAALANFQAEQAAAPRNEAERQLKANELLAKTGDAAADRQQRWNELIARLGESAADRALRSREVDDNSLTNKVKRDAAGLELGSAKQLADLRSAYLNAKTPEEQADAISKLNALSGKAGTSMKDNFMVVGGGQEWDERAMAMRNVPQQLIDLRTNQPVQGGQAQASQPAPQEAAQRKVGSTYMLPNGKMGQWTAQGWLVSN